MTEPDPSRLRRYLLDAPDEGDARVSRRRHPGGARRMGASMRRARAAVLPHLAACARCRGVVASVARALADASVAREVGGGRGRRPAPLLPDRSFRSRPLRCCCSCSRGRGSHRRWRVASGTAGQRGSAGSPVAHRRGGEANVLQWTSLAGADRYRVTLFEAGGRVLYETERADTAATLPDSIGLVPGRSYVWMVEARIGFDRWSTSRLVEFSIVGRRAPVTAFAPLLVAVFVTQSPAADSLRLLAGAPAGVGTGARDAVPAARGARSDHRGATSRTSSRRRASWPRPTRSRGRIRFWCARWRASPLGRRSGEPGSSGPTACDGRASRHSPGMGRPPRSRSGAAPGLAPWRSMTPLAWPRYWATSGRASSRKAGPTARRRISSVRARWHAAIGDMRVEANAVGSLADLSADRGDLATARERYARALALRERIGDSRGVAAVYNNLGLLAQTAGDLDEARRQFEAALAINRRDGRDEVAATNLVNLAGLASLAGDFARAEQLYRDALATWRAREQWADVADALHGLGQLELRRGDYPAARATLLRGTRHLRSHRADHRCPGRAARAGRCARRPRRYAGCAGRAAPRPASRRLGGGAGGHPGGHRTGPRRSRRPVEQLSPRPSGSTPGRSSCIARRAISAGEAEAQQGRGLLLLDREDYARAQTLLETALRTPDAQPGVSGRPR